MTRKITQLSITYVRVAHGDTCNCQLLLITSVVTDPISHRYVSTEEALVQAEESDEVAAEGADPARPLRSLVGPPHLLMAGGREPQRCQDSRSAASYRPVTC